MAESVGTIQNKANEKLTKQSNFISDALVNKLLADIGLISKNNRLVFDTDYFSQLENRIINYTKELGYDKMVNSYLSNYDKVYDNLENYYARQKILLENEAINERINEIYRKQLADSFALENAINARDLARTLREQALLGMTIKEAQANMKALSSSPSNSSQTVMTYRIDQVVHDAIMQYDGLHNANIAQQYDLKDFYYFSSIIETSRPICTHIKDTFPGIITKEQLETVLDEYCPNGQPSKKKIEYETVNGVVRTLQKGSGMIDGTVLSNFAVNRGGYRCRHEVKFTFSTKSSKDIAKSIIDSLD
jgi:hypothetical protein